MQIQTHTLMGKGIKVDPGQPTSPTRKWQDGLKDISCEPAAT